MNQPESKLLFDQNLSNRLPAVLPDIFAGAQHEADVGLAERDDSVIWKYAADHGFTIVSKDDDFRERARLTGPSATRHYAQGPQLLHLNPDASLLVISEAVAFYLLRRTESTQPLGDCASAQDLHGEMCLAH